MHMTYENQICELYFSLHKDNFQLVGSRLHHLLKCIKCDLYASRNNVVVDVDYVNTIQYLKYLYALIGHTRDIYFGHGLRDVSYMMIYVWYEFFPVLAIYAFHRFFMDIDSSPFSSIYGCWNDIKYFCIFIAKISKKGFHDPLIDIAIACANRQLCLDYISLHNHYLSNTAIPQSDTCSSFMNALDEGGNLNMYMSTCEKKPILSNLSKWIPRERNNKMILLVEKLVYHWFSHSEFVNDSTYYHTSNMQKKIYRKMISDNCKILSCSPTNTLLFHRVLRGDSMSDTNTCEKNGPLPFFYENVAIGIYIKTAIAIIQRLHTKRGGSVCALDVDMDAVWLNQKWSRLVSSFLACPDAMPVVDISADIPLNSLYNAIGFACLIASKSGLFRIMLVSNAPIWIDVSGCSSICAMVDKIWDYCQFRSGSQFSYAFKIIGDALTSSIDSHDIQYSIHKPVHKLFIFSDSFRFDWNIFLPSHNPIYKTSQVIFWNIGSQEIDLANKINDSIIFMSGSYPALFSYFCGYDIAEKSSSYSFVHHVLQCSRYSCLTTYFDSILEEFK